MMASREAGPGARAIRAMGAALVTGLAWWLAAVLVDKPFLPAPGPALARLAGRLADGSLLLHLGASASRIGVSLAIAGPLAALLGLAAGRSPASTPSSRPSSTSSIPCPRWPSCPS